MKEAIEESHAKLDEKARQLGKGQFFKKRTFARKLSLKRKIEWYREMHIALSRAKSNSSRSAEDLCDNVARAGHRVKAAAKALKCDANVIRRDISAHAYASLLIQDCTLMQLR